MSLRSLECRLRWRQKGSWLTPVGFGWLFLGIWGLLLSHEPPQVKAGFMLLLPSLWALIALMAVGRGLEPNPTEEAWVALRSALPHKERLYRLQLFFLVLLTVGAQVLSLPLLRLLWDFPWSWMGPSALILGTTMPSFILLGLLIQALMPPRETSGFLLAFILIPLYIPILLWSAGAIEALLYGRPYLPYLALLLALQLALWQGVPWGLSAIERVWL